MTRPPDELRGHFYRAYGLVVQSESPIEALPEIDQQRTDVMIRQGNIADHVNSEMFTSSFANWRAGENVMLLDVPNIARYLIMDGNQIWIEANRSASLPDINAFLLGSAFAALLQQRKFLTIHGSAVMTAGGAALFVGRSGAGKSTILAALSERGYSMISDDIAALLQGAKGSCHIVPSFPATRLKADTLKKLGKSEHRCSTLREDVDKYVLPVRQFEVQAQPVRQVFLLDVKADSAIELQKQNVTEAFRWLSYYTFRKRFYDGMGMAEFHFKAMSDFAKSVEVYTISRPDQPFLLDDLVRCITTNIAEPVPLNDRAKAVWS